MSCGKDKAHLSCWQECPICPLLNCLFLPDIRYYLPLNYTATPHAIAKRHKVCRHTDTLGWWQHVAISQRWQYAEAPTRENCLSVLQAFKAEALKTCITVSQHTRLLSVQQTCKRFTAHPLLFHSFASPLYMQYITPLTDYIKDLLPISTVVGIFPAKLAASETSVKFCFRSCDCEQSSFSSEKSILHT